MGVHLLLVTVFQMVLVGGVGGVVMTRYALGDVLLKEGRTPPPSFATAYHELMWLAQRQRGHVDMEETQRFFQLRQAWQAMHSEMISGDA